MSTPTPPPNDHTSVATITRQLRLLIFVSAVLSTIILACSLVLFGFSSLWITPAAVGMTIIHHPIILANQRKLNKLQSQNPPSPSMPIPTSSRIPMIIYTWFIALTYTAALAITIMSTFYMFAGYYEYWEGRFISAPFEAAFLVLEIPVMITIAVWCMKERKAILRGRGGEEERAVKWYHLPQYRRS